MAGGKSMRYFWMSGEPHASQLFNLSSLIKSDDLIYFRNKHIRCTVIHHKHFHLPSARGVSPEKKGELSLSLNRNILPCKIGDRR